MPSDLLAVNREYPELPARKMKKRQSEKLEPGTGIKF
jgi:hypothetical protein